MLKSLSDQLTIALTKQKTKKLIHNSASDVIALKQTGII
jgi:hypothetical protein